MVGNVVSIPVVNRLYLRRVNGVLSLQILSEVSDFVVKFDFVPDANPEAVQYHGPDGRYIDITDHAEIVPDLTTATPATIYNVRNGSFLWQDAAAMKLPTLAFREDVRREALFCPIGHKQQPAGSTDFVAFSKWAVYSTALPAYMPADARRLFAYTAP